MRRAANVANRRPLGGVIAHLPVRQWVLSLPIPLPVLLAAQPELVTPVLQVVPQGPPAQGQPVTETATTASGTDARGRTGPTPPEPRRPTSTSHPQAAAPQRSRGDAAREVGAASPSSTTFLQRSGVAHRNDLEAPLKEGLCRPLRGLEGGLMI